MKRGQPPLGYTIIEVMIFLVITGALLVSALAIFNGQQNRTRFNQGLREMDAQIRAAATEVETGYYPSRSNFQCRIQSVFGAPSQPVLSTTVSEEQGSNEECVFLGKTVQFGLAGSECTPTNTNNCITYAVHTVVGRRIESNGNETQTLQDPDGGGPLRGAQPRLAVFTPDLAERRTIPGNLRIYDMYEVRGGSPVTIGSVGFMHPLGAYKTGASDPVSGSQSVELFGIAGTTLGQNNTDEANDVRNMTDSQKNPTSVVLCFTDSYSGISRRGAIILGGEGRQLTTEVINDVATGSVPGNRC